MGLRHPPSVAPSTGVVAKGKTPTILVRKESAADTPDHRPGVRDGKEVELQVRGDLGALRTDVDVRENGVQPEEVHEGGCTVERVRGALEGTEVNCWTQRLLGRQPAFSRL